MSDVKIGQLIGADAERDAIHVAIAPVVAAEQLDPGDHVGLNTDGKASESSTHIGIVDPFITKCVQPGERFYLFLYPNTVIGMRHHWMHPAFMSDAKVGKHSRDKSVEWLKRYAVRMNPYDDSEELAYERLRKGLVSGELFANGSDLHELYELNDADDLKLHAAIALGVEVDWSKFRFSCSC